MNGPDIFELMGLLFIYPKKTNPIINQNPSKGLHLVLFLEPY